MELAASGDAQRRRLSLSASSGMTKARCPEIPGFYRPKHCLTVSPKSAFGDAGGNQPEKLPTVDRKSIGRCGATTITR